MRNTSKKSSVRDTSKAREVALQNRKKNSLEKQEKIEQQRQLESDLQEQIQLVKQCKKEIKQLKRQNTVLQNKLSKFECELIQCNFECTNLKLRVLDYECINHCVGLCVKSIKQELSDLDDVYKYKFSLCTLIYLFVF